jgi:hypothetical protein
MTAVMSAMILQMMLVTGIFLHQLHHTERDRHDTDYYK